LRQSTFDHRSTPRVSIRFSPVRDTPGLRVREIQQTLPPGDREFFSIAETRLGGGPINVEHESKIGNALANSKRVQTSDDSRIKLARRTLANCG
jgi:hypothetical protein